MRLDGVTKGGAHGHICNTGAIAYKPSFSGRTPGPFHSTSAPQSGRKRRGGAGLSRAYVRLADGSRKRDSLTTRLPHLPSVCGYLSGDRLPSLPRSAGVYHATEFLDLPTRPTVCGPIVRPTPQLPDSLTYPWSASVYRATGSHLSLGLRVLIVRPSSLTCLPDLGSSGVYRATGSHLSLGLRVLFVRPSSLT